LPPASSTGHGPASVTFIRHAEKQLGDVAPRSVTIDGLLDPNSLTPRGWQRAGALIGLFVPRADEAQALLPTPAHLFASKLGPHSHSQRPRETLEPLSERLGVPIDASHVQDDLDGLERSIRQCQGHVLVAWEHKRIPLIAARLAADPSLVPTVWPDDRYDVIWVLTASPSNGELVLRQIPELLLHGDRPEAIGLAG
jgi:broad specificity phosphatase PhoE